jgi:RHS repeat-associated protein
MFTMRSDQMAILRKQALGDALARTFDTTNQKATRDPASGDVLITDPVGRTVRCSFDERGFIGGIKGPLGRSYRLENDPTGQTVGLTTPSGLRVGMDHDSTGRVTRVSYGARTLFDLEYDEVAAGLSRIRYPDQTSVQFRYYDDHRFASITDRLGNPISFAYDDLGRLTTITDANGRGTAFQYGGWSRPDATVFPDGHVESYEYDPDGRVRRIAAGADPYAEIARDDSGRPIEIRYGDGEVLRFAYDNQGRVVEALNPEIAVRYEYDDEGRLAKEDQAGQVVAYKYNPAGDLVGLTYPTGETVAIQLDEELRLGLIKDWEGGLHRYVYADQDRGYTHFFPNGVKAEVAQAETGQLVAISVRSSDPTGRDGWRLEFEYDAEDRLRTFKNSDFGSKCYVYDAESQLLEVQSEDEDAHEFFAYDPAGNRTSHNGMKAEFNSLNQLLNQGAIHCRYDTRGNLEDYDGPEGHWRFTYNRRNLLVRADSHAGHRVDFGYDAYGRRLWKTSGTKQVRYIWAGEHLVREVETDGAQTVTRDYLYEPGTHIPLALRINGEVYCCHNDHLGTPIRLTNRLGRVAWSADYRAFGQAQIKTASISNALRFPGQYFDEETGLHYNRFRYYAPALGRYLSPDPVSFRAGLNFYVYVNNDPVNRTDPLGLWWKAAVSILAGVAVAAAIVLTAPVSLPTLAVAAAATVVGVGAGVGVNKVLNLKAFCPLCIVKGFVQGFAQGFVIGAAVTAAVITFPAWGTAIAVGGAVVGSYAILQEHLGWHLFPWEKKSIPYDQMTSEQQNESLGRLGGQFAGAPVGGAAAKGLMVPEGVGPTGAGNERVQNAARSAADEAQNVTPKDMRPPTAAALETKNGDILTGTSHRGEGKPELHPDVQQTLDDIPANERAPEYQHGKCAEPQIISDALNQGKDPSGGKMSAVKVRPEGNPKHGTPIEACPSCKQLLKAYDIQDVSQSGQPSGGDETSSSPPGGDGTSSPPIAIPAPTKKEDEP